MSITLPGLHCHLHYRANIGIRRGFAIGEIATAPLSFLLAEGPFRLVYSWLIKSSHHNQESS